MKTRKDIEKQVEKTFNALDAIENITVSTDFKDQVMQRLFEEKERPETKMTTWLTPNLQIAAIFCVLLINIVGLIRLNTTNYEKNLSQFANSYELSQDQKTSFFN